MITASSVFIIFFVSWTQIIDLSKELDKIKTDFLEENEKINKLNVDKKNKSVLPVRREVKQDHSYPRDHNDDTTPKNLMKWKDLIQSQIMLLSLSYGFMRCIVSTSVTDVTLVSTKTFQWEMQTLALLHMTLGSSSYLMITLLVKLKVFRGNKTIFFSYVLGVCTALVILSILILPKAIEFQTRPSQIAFGGVVLFLKCFVYFQAQSSGKFLIFNAVSFENANFVDGFRSLVGSIFRVICKAFLFYFFLYPEYFAPAMFGYGLVMVLLLLATRNTFYRHC